MKYAAGNLWTNPEIADFKGQYICTFIIVFGLGYAPLTDYNPTTEVGFLNSRKTWAVYACEPCGLTGIIPLCFQPPLEILGSTPAPLAQKSPFYEWASWHPLCQ